ncbi:hypothetical protein GYH30_021643 [Glycine max]|uniref:WAT1-related protein n=2 Tax=Glycine subgen. Soja TaxID=1462606 RepID=A0A0R0IU78_SOYBN|nr:hypothetical protein GYH30_021643 [Glycine max]RZB97532.1 WAT1-related protein [Glycine soja]
MVYDMQQLHKYKYTGKVVHGLKPALLMLVVQISFASVHKLATNDGMSVRIVTAYGLIFATASTSIVLNYGPNIKVFLTFSNYNHDNINYIFSPKLTWRVIYKSLFLAYLAVEINIWTFHINLLHKKGTTGTLNGNSGSKLLGIFCGLGSCFCFALWLIIQAQMSIEFPSHLSSTALMSLMGAGIRGPLYASVFNPLMLVAIASSLMLDENLYLGSVIGAVLIVIGLYMVLWGKSKEMKKVTDLETTLELEEIEVVVTSTAAADHDKCMRSNDSYTCSSKSNNKIVGKDHDNASKREHEGQDNENN